MVAFSLAVLFLIGTPGPGVLSTAGVGAAFGMRAGLVYCGGLFLGNLLVGLAVVTGMAALLLSVPWLRTALFAASILYLLYLAARIAFAGSGLAFIRADRPPGFVGGLALQPVNPKAYVVNAALFTGFPFLPGQFLAEVVAKFVILNAIWIPIHLLWLYGGVVLHRLDLPSRAHFAINLAMAAAMILVVAIAALATL